MTYRNQNNTNRRNISGILYKIARGIRIAEVASTGNKKYLGRYIKNVALDNILWHIVKRLK